MIKSKKIILTELRNEDLKLLLKWINDYGTNRFLTVKRPYSEFEEENWYKKTVSSPDTSVYLIRSAEAGGRPIGVCSAQFDFQNGSVHIGIYIGEKTLRGKGLGTATLILLLDYLFINYPIERAELEVFAHNKRAIACYRKAGFVVEGVKRHAIFREAKYIDVIIMGMLRKEWMQLIEQRGISIIYE